MSEQFLATAFVRIKPDVRGFKGELQKNIKEALKIPIPPVKVLIRPDVRGFKTKLDADLKKIKKEFFVPVIPQLKKGQVVGAKSGDGGAVEKTERLTAAQQRAATKAARLAEIYELNAKAAQAMTVAFARASVLTDDLASSQTRLAGATAGAKLAEEGLVQAKLAGADVAAVTLASTRDSLLRIAQEEVLNQEQVATKKILAGTTEQVTAAQIAHAAALAKSVPLEKQQEAIEAANVAVKKALASVTKELAVAEGFVSKELAASLASQKASLGVAEANLKVRANEVSSAIRQEAAQKGLIQATAELNKALAVETKSLTTLNEVSAANAALTKALKAEKKAFAAAEKAGVVGIEAESVALRAQSAVLAQNLELQAAALKSQAALASQAATAARGGLATFLSALGARGATLAAGGEFLAGAAAITAFLKAVQGASRLQTELNVFQATSKATAEQMAEVRRQAVALGADITLPAVSASDAATAFTQLAKAGLSVRDSIDGARGVLQLATAAQIDNAQATELVASGLNAFGLAGIQAAHVADLLTGASNEAQGSIEDMGIALQQSSAVARQAGLSLEDTVAFITLLAQAGIRGSDAGTSLRTSLLRLIAPTEDAAKQLKALNIQVFDLQGNIRPEVFSELEEALKGMNAQARNQTLRKIFGQDAIRAAVIFGREGTTGLNEVRAAIEEQGLASQLAAARTKGFAGSVEALKNSIATLSVSFGNLVLGPLQVFIKSITGAVSGLNDLVAGLGRVESIAGEAIGKLNDLAKVKIGPIDIDLGDTDSKINKISGEILSRVVGPQAGFVLTLNLATQGEETVQRRLIGITTEADKARQSVKEILDELNQSQSPSALNEAALALGELIRKLQDGGPEAQKVSLAIQRLLEKIQNADFTLPPFKFPPIEIPPELKSGRPGAEIAKASGDALKAAFPGVFAIGQTYLDMFGKGVESKLPNLFSLFTQITASLNTRILDLQEDFNKQVASGNQQGQKSNLQAQIAAQQKIIDEANKKIANVDTSKPGGPSQLQKLKEQRRAAQAAIATLTGQIAGIESSITSDLKQKSDDIQKAKDEQDAAALKAFGREEESVANRILEANATEGLKDDIKTNITLRGILRQQIREAGKKIKDLETRRDFIHDTTQRIIQLNAEIKADQKAQAQALRQEARDKRENAIQGIELDIDLAVITENRQREISLRRKLIKALEDQIKHEKGNVNKIKELRNEIARQKKEIEKARGDTKDRNNAFQKLTFEFLQTQQGFAANLLGNLIPLGITGLVGGTSVPASSQTSAISDPFIEGQLGPSPEDRLKKQGGLASATGGPTRGGQSRELVLLEQIKQILHAIHRGNGVPEAKHSKAVTGGSTQITHHIGGV